MPLIAITRLRVRSWRYLPVFFVQAVRTARQARDAEGSLAVSVLRDGNRTFWTRTVWTDEQAMKAYLLSGIHRKVMRSLARWCDEASVAHWTQDNAAEPPSWEEVHRQMRQRGRASRVNQPTTDHLQFRIPAPCVRPTGMLRFK